MDKASALTDLEGGLKNVPGFFVKVSFMQHLHNRQSLSLLIDGEYFIYSDQT